MTDFNRIRYRAVIEFLTLENVSPQQIHNQMTVVYSEDVPSYATEKRWAAKFRRGRKSFEGEPRSRHPSAAVCEENCRATKTCSAKLSSQCASDSRHSGHKHWSSKDDLAQILLMTSVCAQWVPRMLDQKMKDFRRKTSSENLKFMQLKWNLFVKRIITGYETWIHHDDPETKQQNMQWKHASSPSPRKFKVQASASKIMCTVSRMPKIYC